MRLFRLRVFLSGDSVDFRLLTAAVVQVGSGVLAFLLVELENCSLVFLLGGVRFVAMLPVERRVGFLLGFVADSGVFGLDSVDLEPVSGVLDRLSETEVLERDLTNGVVFSCF